MKVIHVIDVHASFEQNGHSGQLPAEVIKRCKELANSLKGKVLGPIIVAYPPAAKPIVGLIINLIGCDHAAMQLPNLSVSDGQSDVWQKSLDALQFCCKLTKREQTIVLFSDGQSEIRLNRLVLLNKGVNLEEQDEGLVFPSSLKLYDGPLGEEEGFSYDLAVTEAGEILLAAEFNSIRQKPDQG